MPCMSWKEIPPRHSIRGRRLDGIEHRQLAEDVGRANFVRRPPGLWALAICALFSLGPVEAGTPATPAAVRTISVALDSRYLRPDYAAFARGFRRAIQQQVLLIEREDRDGGMVDLGRIPNGFVLSRQPGRTQCAEYLGYRAVRPDSGHGGMNAPDSVILVRLSGWSSTIVDYWQRPGTPGSKWEDPNEEIDRPGVTVRIACCAANTLAELPDSVWVPLRVEWSQRKSDGVRTLEIHGWMVGMGVLQLMHERAGILESGVELVFESRGRNR